MPIQFQPKPGSIVICDFSGYIVPEIVKRRPVVVIAKNRTNSQLVTVVPLSTTEPKPKTACHHELSGNPIPGNAAITMWAKCDIVATVSLARIELYRTKPRGAPKRIFHQISVTPEDFAAIKVAVLHALHLP